VIEKQRPQLVEELLTTRTYHKDNDPIVVNKTSFFDKLISPTSAQPEASKDLPSRSVSNKRNVSASRRSADSVNTEVLLQSTDEFMRAIHSFSSESNNQSNRETRKSEPTTAKSAADRLNNNTKQNGMNKYGNRETTPRRSVADAVTAR